MRPDGSVGLARRPAMGTQLVKAVSRPAVAGALAAIVVAQLVLGFHIGVTIVLFALVVGLSLVNVRTGLVEASGVGAREAAQTLPPLLRTRVLAVMDRAEEVRNDALELGAGAEVVVDGLDSLIIAVFDLARQAESVDQYLGRIRRHELETQAFRTRQRADADPSLEPTAASLQEQLDVVDRIIRKRDTLDQQMDGVAAELGALHARVVQSLVERVDVPDIAAQLGVMRDRTKALALGFEEVAQIGPPDSNSV